MTKMLTKADFEKLPTCIHDFFGKCDLERKEQDQVKQRRICLECALKGLFRGLIDEDIATATNMLDKTIKILKEMNVL